MTIAHAKVVGAALQGAPFPSEEITLDLTSLIIYAAATWDFHRYHYDSAFVKNLGLPAPFVDGQMIGALLASRLMRWGGPNAFVRKLGYRQRATVYVDETIVIGGAVTSCTIENGQRIAVLNLTVTKADGTPVVRDGAATINLGPE
ncbi:MAG TPA: MaoC/PaaZ C-terminal domain-containing protein [Candidatus Binataceae bacterium]|nr:MaoC/PaaZ C-terminal domain-containing protein [Candidatus Binataceae bacterium]